MTDTLLDSYSEVNQDDYLLIDAGSRVANGQSFTTPASPTYKLTSVKFYLRVGTAQTGTIYAKLYAHTGTYGVDGKPTGGVLATSDAFDVSVLTTSYVLHEFFFSGAQQYVMSANTYYCITVGFPVSLSGDILMGIDNSAPTHLGNAAQNWEGTWYALADSDVIFYVYGLGALPSPKGTIAIHAKLAGII